MLSTKIHCNDCDRKIIGETGRNLTTRLSEHQRDIRNGKKQSQVFQHARNYDHNFNFSEPEIIHRSANIFVRRRLEAFYSQKSNYSINRYQEINEMCLPLIR